MRKTDEGRKNGGRVIITLIVVSCILAVFGTIYLVVEATVPNCTVVRVGQSQIVRDHLVEVRQQDELGQQTSITVGVGSGETPIYTGDLVIRRFGYTADITASFAGQVLAPTTLTIPTRTYAGFGGNIVGIELCDK